LVSCGTGAASSTIVATRLKDELAERGIDVITKQCNVGNIAENLEGIDLLLTTSKIHEDVGVPAFNGVPLLTGVGSDQLVDDIVEALKNI
jgi:PTS system galactitol-specific IIB component